MGSPPLEGDSLLEVAVAILEEPTADIKAEWTQIAADLWREGRLTVRLSDTGEQLLLPPDKPARDAQVTIMGAGAMPKRGRGGTLVSRQRMLHSLVHTESWAVDLAWDVIARFGGTRGLPRAFFDDFVAVAEDEARHFRVLQARLVELGSSYGAMPAHDGLWESAAATAHSLAARLAVESCVHEARGLDVLPQTIARFRAGGDEATAALLERTVYPEEVTHCAAGVRWLTWLHSQAHGGGETAGLMGWPTAGGDAAAQQAEPRGPEGGFEAAQKSDSSREGSLGDASRQATEKAGELGVLQSSSSGGDQGDGGRASQQATEDEVPCSLSAVDGGKQLEWMVEGGRYATVEAWFHELVRKHFWGGLKPPFNEPARHEAGLLPSWYMPLSKPV